MRYIVAVSGGVDSVVLLHQLVAAGEHELLVAHFDHGIRDDSMADARFVEQLAVGYGLPFITRREELGVGASEELARRRRYRFLRQVAGWQNAVIVTAHHRDDVIESVAINLTRGTGWRGLAVLDSADIIRPLLDQPKQQLYQYALEHRLEWVEDSTNSSGMYLRNRLRSLINTRLNPEVKAALWKLRNTQLECRAGIRDEVARLLPGAGEYSRHLVIMSDDDAAAELLRAIVARTSPLTPTRPQLQLAVLAIKTARARSIHQIGDGTSLYFTKRTFIVETTKGVVS